MKRVSSILSMSLLFLSAYFLSAHTAHAYETGYTQSHRYADHTSLNTSSSSVHLCIANALGPLGLVYAGIHTLYSWWKSDASDSTPAHITPIEQPTIKQALVIPDRITRHEACNLPPTHYQQQYALDDTTTLFLQQHALNIREYQSCVGTPIQHALHQECITLAHDTAHLDISAYPTFIQYQTLLAAAIDAGRACTHENAIGKAYTMLDWAHALMRYVHAVSNGVIDGAQHTLHALTHPRRFVAQLSHDAHELVCITLRIFYECGLIETLIDVDNDALLDAYISDRSVCLTMLAERIQHYATTLTKPNGIRTAVASATHMLLTGKCLHAIGKFFSFAARNTSCMIERIGDLAATDTPIATSADGILVNAAQETAQHALRAAEQQLPKANAIHTVAAYEPPAVHIERIAKKYPAWATNECKPLVHILKGHDVKGKLRGLHHDYGGYLESLGYIEITKQYPNGMYVANVLYNGGKFEKTFFPKNWSPEQLITQINKAMERATIWKMDRGRKVTWVNIDGEKVRIVLEIDNRIVSVFPDFNSEI